MSIVHSPPLGGGGTAYAYIKVNYPVGSTCICSNGSKTLHAKDTSGEYIFYIPEAGTWTVRAYDGSTYEGSTNKKSDSRNIATRNQMENVLLTYTLEIYSYGTYGLPMTNVIGADWANTIGSFSEGSSNFTISAKVVGYASQSIARRTVNKVDISGYNTLNINAVLLDAGARRSAGGLYSADRIDSNIIHEVAIGTVEKTYSIDISGYNSTPQYVGVTVGSISDNYRLKVNHIWLE